MEPPGWECDLGMLLSVGVVDKLYRSVLELLPDKPCCHWVMLHKLYRLMLILLPDICTNTGVSKWGLLDELYRLPWLISWRGMIMAIYTWLACPEMTCRDQSSYAPSQWETSLHCYNVSHWLGPYLDWSLPMSVIWLQYRVVSGNKLSNYQVPTTLPF